jgi:23S rRNA-/tRNA-specific pseudouridylate synthase
MRVSDPPILFDADDWIVLDKPAGLLTTPRTKGEASLVLAAQRMRPKSAHWHPLSRLDAPVTGAVLFALSDWALATAAAAKEAGEYQRWYAGLAGGVVEGPSGEWAWRLEEDPKDRARRRCGEGPTSVDALTRWTVLGAGDRATALGFVPVTGRTHQIRVHAARAGVPLLGDVAYGGARRLTSATGAVLAVPRVMLHARAVKVPGRPSVVTSPWPADFAVLREALLPTMSAWPP